MKRGALFLIVSTVLLLNCSKSNNGADGADGKISLVDFIAEPAGPNSNCPQGGFKAVTGIDQNGNGTLDAAEIQNTKYICNGAPGSGGEGSSGFNSVVSVVNEPNGGNCATGGKKINFGLDQNRNNLLDNNEISSSTYVCNGAAGTGGGGTNGYNSLVSVVAEPIGVNCAGGGNRINYGLDVNRNNVLDAGEITNTTFMCNANRVYASVVSQAGSGAPIGIPLVNNLDITVTWSRIGVGRYLGTINKNMNIQKTIVLSNNTSVTTALQSANTILLENRCAVETFCDGFTNVTVGLLVVD
ncbi:DUF7151 family protein [Niabella insulamsoli]|uniref:DUF7151 family protein n=1 Tax=Niabella insulamsoli TaxID=3144874 RepID=UPI0031FE1DFE